MKTNNQITKDVSILYNTIGQIIEDARNTVYRTANMTMVKAYWHIGKTIVEEEQNGNERAEYGKELIKQLAEQLTQKYGKGFTETNLKYMRQLYRFFEKSHSLRDELSWTHYRLLLRVDNEQARLFYMQEAITCNWPGRLQIEQEQKLN